MTLYSVVAVLPELTRKMQSLSSVERRIVVHLKINVESFLRGGVYCVNLKVRGLEL